MWDLPRPGLEPVSPALAGRLSTTVPPGKPKAGGFLITAEPPGKSPLFILDLGNFFFFWPCCAACGVLIPLQGIEPWPMAVKALSPNHWTAREKNR